MRYSLILLFLMIGCGHRPPAYGAGVGNGTSTEDIITPEDVLKAQEENKKKYLDTLDYRLQKELHEVIDNINYGLRNSIPNANKEHSFEFIFNCSMDNQFCDPNRMIQFTSLLQGKLEKSGWKANLKVLPGDTVSYASVKLTLVISPK